MFPLNLDFFCGSFGLDPLPFDDAARTLEVTTQRIRQNPDSSLSHNASTNDSAVGYRRVSKFSTDTLFATKWAKSLRGNTCAQIFVSDKDFCAIFLMKKESEYILALKQFVKDVGAPETLFCDLANTQKKREVKDFCTQMGTTLSILEAETQWANWAELFVGLVKGATRKDLRESGLPIVLWDYCMERRCLIYQVTAKKLFQLHGSTPTLPPLEPRLTFQTCVSLVGMSGFTTETNKLLSHFRRSVSDGVLDLLGMREM